MALEGDFPNTLLDDVRPRSQERAPGSRASLQPDQETNEANNSALLVRRHGQALQQRRREGRLERRQLCRKRGHRRQLRLSLFNELHSVVPLSQIGRAHV